MSDQDVLVLAREALAGDPASLVKLIAAIVRTHPVEPVNPKEARKIRFDNFYCDGNGSHRYTPYSYGSNSYQIHAPPDSAMREWQIVWTHMITAYLNQLLADAAKRGVEIVKPGDRRDSTPESLGGSTVTCQELCS